ncbi:hypothetical protein SPF06_19940 [Sinomonas sp. JGH33]|uniref:Uncharacterized protein n=1 Tax=Sinomonas terricola TaxID=3110330 RepID=A0ABU5TC33_9MICC|nr:hypothetical protein [Sinomonas sp. JGH33]MEA5457001.1 hypothetical protein [Sinomonas sp. JGH33]
MSEQYQPPGPQPRLLQRPEAQRSGHPNPALPHWQSPPPLPRQPLPASGGIRFVGADDAEYARRWRLSVGTASLVLGVAAPFYGWQTAAALRAANSISAAGRHVSQTVMTTESLVVALFGAAAVAYAAVGIWNIVARRGLASGPLIGAMMLAMPATVPIVILLILALMVHSHSAVSLLYGAFAANVVMISRSISVLRLKREQTSQLAR